VCYCGKPPRDIDIVEKTIEICSLVRSGLAETPYRIYMTTLLDAYIDKVFRDPLFRSTISNILKYLMKRENIGTINNKQNKKKNLLKLSKTYIQQ